MISLINHIEDICVNNTIDMLKFNNIYQSIHKQEQLKAPVYMNVLKDALGGNILKEIRHSQILYHILQHQDTAKSFIKYFFPSINTNNCLFNIPYPDFQRIDLSIRSKDFCIIIESKINEANEQETQIKRYIDRISKNYNIKNIYVLYLNKDSTEYPSTYSFPDDYRNKMGDRFICRSFKHDIISWLSIANNMIDIKEQPYLKSSIITYINYLKTLLNDNSRLENMNNRIEKEISTELGLESMPLDKRIELLKDKIDSLEMLKKNLKSMLDKAYEQQDGQYFRSWYKQIVEAIGTKLAITQESYDEIGFNFIFRKVEFRCVISCDDYGYYWGVKGVTENTRTKTDIFEKLAQIVLLSNCGFRNNEEKFPEWAILDYDEPDFIVERFLTLSDVIVQSPQCKILYKKP